jgi:hypothetical protein
MHATEAAIVNGFELLSTSWDRILQKQLMVTLNHKPDSSGSAAFAQS